MAHARSGEAHRTEQIPKLAMAAAGVVFGDIGTSPLYAVQECFGHGLTPEPQNILGVISLIFWSLTIVVSIKYTLIIMRADNHGEGGVFSLLALALRTARRVAGVHAADSAPNAQRKDRALVWHIILIGMFGAALFFGDSIITPAISVLSAVEGLNVVSPHLQDCVIPLTLGILVVLFILQRFGSQKIGNSFGPIMIGWFLCIACLGLVSILKAPLILQAVNPVYALKLLAGHGALSVSILGCALLAFTGGEALYADMGHFGVKSIRLAWYGLVMPSLVINYFGQGALLLADPHKSINPFYLLAPSALTLPMIVLASVATVIASQAVISGTFSLVRQAIQMDYLPRFSIVHTSSLEQGQVYVPKVNLILCLGVVMLVLLFRSSSALAGAYGFAVGGAMLVDTLLVFYVARFAWRWMWPSMMAVFVPLLIFDFAYFSAASAKIPDGGWLPLSIGSTILLIFVTWRQGRDIVHESHHGRHQDLETFISSVAPESITRTPGTSVYLAAKHDYVPPALVSSFYRYNVVRENIIVLQIAKEDAPYVDEHRHVTIRECGHGFWQVTLHYGFAQRVQVANDLRKCFARFSEVDLDNVTFFVGRSIFVVGPHEMKPRWRKKLFLWLANNVEQEFDYSRLPSEQLIQIGTQIEV